MTNLWDQLALTESAKLRAFGAYIARREERRLVQFLMALHDEFEGLHRSILHRHPLPSVDSVVSKLLVEEIRLKPLVVEEVFSASTPSVFAMPPRSNFKSHFRPYGSVAHDKCGFCLPSSPSGISPSSWILDSGASNHMSPNLSSFTSLTPKVSVPITSASGTPMPLQGVGSVITLSLSLSNVYHIPSLALNLASVGQICDTGCSGSKFSGGALGNLKTHDISDCSGYKLAKFTALPFPKSIIIYVAPFYLIHSDVWGPSPVSTKRGSRYYVSFIDDCTRYCWVYLMKCRSDFFGIYNKFRSLVKTHYSAVIKCFRYDFGGEYTSHAFKDLLALDGTLY
ncbi:uncharacterized protein LOC125370282 [Ricinus communis]|uniref:uncharacterized protein LOC125370282 n=1 Tax=Ricinus communis TaxID=3988 RepID=UPI00201AB305|nr:uncharacterized protein LOC125370282 [Ricinus communis]